MLNCIYWYKDNLRMSLVGPMENIVVLSIIAGIAALYILDRVRDRNRKDMGDPGNVVFEKPGD